MLKGFVVLSLVAAFLLPASLAAQSCVLTRLDSPVLNAFDDEFNPAGEHQKWQLTVGWRYGYSFRHFVGTEEQPQRLAEHSQVVNNVNLADFALRYNVDARTSVTVGVPYLMATRDGALRGENREVVKRYQRSDTSGIGDITVVGKRLLWDPAAHRRSNFSIGLGVKFPTGAYRQEQTRLSLVDGEEVASTGTADFSVQPGDGSWGFVLETSGYKVLNQSGSLAFYGTATYIFEPEATNGVERPGADPFEEEVSATDQYVGRVGLQVGPHSWNGWSFAIGGRIEGIPVHDAFGSSTGRRRPGYMLSLEPSVTWTRGAYSFTLGVPVAVERNRQRSVSDIFLDEEGDAAFPDYLVIAGISRRF